MNKKLKDMDKEELVAYIKRLHDALIGVMDSSILALSIIDELFDKKYKKALA